MVRKEFDGWMTRHDPANSSAKRRDTVQSSGVSCFMRTNRLSALAISTGVAHHTTTP